MKNVTGDLLQLARNGEFDVIVHGCNCFCTMGAGIAKSIKAQFPEAYRADLLTAKGDKKKLGTISWAHADQLDLIIVNGYIQFNWQGSGRKVEYDAVSAVFKRVKNQFSGQRIGYPALGAGLAGGDWAIISAIISAELRGEDHTFVAYLP